MAINPVREALKKLLSSDKKLEELSKGGIHYQLAPASADMPYVIFQKMAGTPTDAFDGPSLDRDVWLIKGVGDAEQAEEIHQRCYELLQGATLNITGRENQDLRKIADVDYLETDKGEPYHHVGAEYKLNSEEE